MTSSSAHRPWEDPELFPPKPAGSDFGIIHHRTSIGCSLAELQDRIRNGWGRLPLVWIPDSPRLIPAAEAAILFDVVKARLLTKMIWSAVRWILLGAGLAGLVLFAAKHGSLDEQQARTLAEMLVFFLGLFPAFQAFRNYRVLQTFVVRDMISYGRWARYDAWLRRRRPLTTWALAAFILIVAACQWRIGFANSIELAALLKPVPPGQWWRLLTSALMHANLIHLGVNLFSLIVLGRWVEAHARASYLPVVFVLAALAGSLASLYFGHQSGPTVGASGGLMGLIGFLAVLGYRRRAMMPYGFFQTMLINVVLVGSMGFSAPGLIDNAAHFGGLCAGVLIGLSAFTNSAIRLRGKSATAAGGAAMLVLLVTCTQAVSALWGTILPPAKLIRPGYFDVTDQFNVIFGRVLKGKYKIARATQDSRRGPTFDDVQGTFLQAGTYVFKFDELDAAGQIYQSRWIRVVVSPRSEPLPTLICPNDEAWLQYRQGTVATQPNLSAVVLWTEESPNAAAGRWRLAGIEYGANY